MRVAMGGAVALLGCMSPVQRVQSQFSARFDCAEVAVTEDGFGHYEASGCGRTGTYECNHARCELSGGAAELATSSEPPAPPMTNELWLNIKLEFAVLTLTATPEVGDTMTLSVLSSRRGCELALLVDGERVHAKGGKRDELTLTRLTARALAKAQRIVLKACDERWTLDDTARRKITAFVLRFEEDLALQEGSTEGENDGKLPPRGGWQPWTSLTSQPAASSGGPPLEAPALFQKVAPSVLRIEVTLQLGQAQGSGVAISPTQPLTNCHVLEGALKVTARQANQSYGARLVRSDPATDRCVLEVAGSPLVPITSVRPLADLKVGETLYTLGAPSGLELSLANGILSAVREIEGAKFVQTTAPISPGSSGGGLFDSSGNLVGITTMVLVGRERLNQSLNFAIPAEAFWRP